MLAGSNRKQRAKREEDWEANFRNADEQEWGRNWQTSSELYHPFAERETRCHFEFTTDIAKGLGSFDHEIILRLSLQSATMCFIELFSTSRLREHFTLDQESLAYRSKFRLLMSRDSILLNSTGRHRLSLTLSTSQLCRLPFSPGHCSIRCSNLFASISTSLIANYLWSSSAPLIQKILQVSLWTFYSLSNHTSTESHMLLSESLQSHQSPNSWS